MCKVGKEMILERNNRRENVWLGEGVGVGVLAEELKSDPTFPKHTELPPVIFSSFLQPSMCSMLHAPGPAALLPASASVVLSEALSHLA